MALMTNSKNSCGGKKYERGATFQQFDYRGNYIHHIMYHE
jgi:hypothetical protein